LAQRCGLGALSRGARGGVVVVKRKKELRFEGFFGNSKRERGILTSKGFGERRGVTAQA